MEGEQLTLSYLAGLIDGEGCFSYQSSGIGKKKRLTLQVNMTDREPLDLLAATFGGNVIAKKAGRENWKSQWRWRIKDETARAAHQRLLPYLLIKRQPLNAVVN